ncbi:MAG: nucleotidyltransferase domain-containing protein [Vulcanimicrobiota bacterium]
MDKGRVVETLKKFNVSLEKRGIQVTKLILYGSYAQGTYREESDIDVVIVSASFSGKSLWERIGVITPSLREFTEPIEAVAITPEEWEKEESLIIVFAKQGEVIYAA